MEFKIVGNGHEKGKNHILGNLFM